MKKFTKTEYKCRAAKAVATKAANKLLVANTLPPESIPIETVTKKQKSLKVLAEIILAKNEAFNSMSKTKKRIAIAQDVIDMLNTKKIIANSGKYILGLDHVDQDIDAQQLMLKNKFPQCDTCAWGACVLAIAHLGDSLTVGDLNEMQEDPDYAYKVKNKVLSIFTPEQVAMIEAAFEKTETYLAFGGSVNNSSNYVEDINLNSSSEFGRSFNTDDERLRAIMQNIVDHKGTFQPVVSKKKVVKRYSFNC